MIDWLTTCQSIRPTDKHSKAAHKQFYTSTRRNILRHLYFFLLALQPIVALYFAAL